MPALEQRRILMKQEETSWRYKRRDVPNLKKRNIQMKEGWYGVSCNGAMPPQPLKIGALAKTVLK
jgi:hypothetical protein